MEEDQKNTGTNKNKKIMWLIIYFISLIIIEVIVENKAFNYSLEFLKGHLNISNNTKKFFKITSLFSTEEFTVPIIYILFFIFPLKITYNLFLIYFISKYIDAVLKIAFTSPRPYWLDHALIVKCHSGYGNPSGHCFAAFSFYFAIAHILTKNTNLFKNIFAQIFLWTFTIILLVLILIGRILLVVHTLDQCIFGALLGLGLYYYFYWIKNSAYSKKTDFEFIKSKVKKFDLRKNVILFLSFILISTSVFYLFYSEKWTLKYLETFRALKCPGNVDRYMFPSEKGYIISYHFLGYFGAVYGLLFLDYKLKNNNSILFTFFKTKNKRERYFVIFSTSFTYALILLVIHENRKFPFWFNVPLFCFFFSFGMIGFVSLSKYSLVSKDEYVFGNLEKKFKESEHTINSYEDDESNLLDN